MEIINTSVIQVGNKMMITVPCEWLKMHRIAKGDKLQIAVINSAVVVMKPEEWKFAHSTISCGFINSVRPEDTISIE